MKPIGMAVLVVLLATLVFCTTAAAGGKTFDAADLKGTFAFISHQVRWEFPPEGNELQVNYCSGYGTLEFDGVSSLTVVSHDRCSLNGSTIDTISVRYVVDPDGTVLIVETIGDAVATHCKLVEHGRTLLCDGTLSGPDTLSFTVVAVRE
jgi:hypothetical protein